MKKLGWPTLFCNSLIVGEDGMITGYQMRISDSKYSTVRALQSVGFETIASGDSFNDLKMIQAGKAGFLFRTTDQIRKDHPAFSDRAARYILPTWNLHILGLVMEYKEERIIEKPSAAITYFVPDERKEGGQYVTLHGRVRRIDYFDEMLILTDGKKIKLGDILEIRLKDRAEDV